MSARRGDVWLVDFGTPIGREQGYRGPAIVVASDRLNASRAGLVIVVPTTTRPRGIPSHIELQPGLSGLDEVSYAKCEDIKSVSVERLVHRLGTVDLEGLHHIAVTVHLLLDS